MFQQRLLTLSGLVLLTILAIVPALLGRDRNVANEPDAKFRTALAGPNLYLRLPRSQWAGLARFLFVLVRYPKHEHMDRNRDIQFN